jgi:hypothetical protein
MNMGIRVLALLLLSAVAAHAQGALDPSGHWEGGIDTPEGSIGVVVDLAKNRDGQIAGTIGVPPQNLKRFPLVIESADGRSSRFDSVARQAIASFKVYWQTMAPR